MAVNFFTVRATMTDGNRAETSWAFSDECEAEKKFNEVCGPLCTEAWLISWTDHPSIRAKKQVHLRRHWTASSGIDETPIRLGDVKTSDEDAPQETSDDVLDTQFDWDTLFERAPDDSEVFLFIDPDRFSDHVISGSTYSHFEIGFRKISFARKPRRPDYESCFSCLTFSCQWDSNGLVTETYGWTLSYRNAGDVGLKRAQRMAEMLGKIQKAEKSLPSRPQSFGEYVALMAKGLGFKSDVMAFRKGDDTVETQSVGNYPPLNALELQDFVNQLIADRRQSGRALTPAEQNKPAPDVSVRDDNAGSGDLSRRTTKFKSTVVSLGTLVLLYAVSWVFGQHGHTYNIEPAKQAADAAEVKPATDWQCAEGQEGPFWENGKGRDPVCHDPVRQCPVLWFPVATQSPCPYKDPLGGPYTQEDLFVLNQMRNPPGR